MARDQRSVAMDSAVAVGVVGLALVGLAASPPNQSGFRNPDVVAVALAVAQGAPLIAIRWRPWSVFGVIWTATAAFLALEYPPVTTALAGIAVASYGMGAYASVGPASLRTATTAAGILALVTVAVLSGYSPAEGMAVLLFLVTAWVLGERARTRRQYLTALRDRAESLERERETQAAVAAAQERTRIARELHDVIAHGVTVIVLHARGARDALQRDPDGTRRSLELIEQTGRDALQELRTVLGSLRTDNRSESLEPQPRLVDLDELVRRTAEGGLRISVTVEGTTTPLPAAVELSAYRIIQESLANVLKHSTAEGAAVVIRYDEDRLTVQVSDGGPPRRGGASMAGGHGLIGMRERVASLGGRLETGPAEDGGYTVVAVLPLTGAHQ